MKKSKRVHSRCAWMPLALLILSQSAHAQSDYFPVESGTELVFGEHINFKSIGPSNEKFDTITVHIDSVDVEPGFCTFRRKTHITGTSVTGAYAPYPGSYSALPLFDSNYIDTVSFDFGTDTTYQTVLVNG